MPAVDPVTVQVMRNRIAGLMDEMHHRFYRSGYSTIVRESRDFSCVILSREGRLIVPPPMLFHGTVYVHLVRRILDLYGTDGLADGDVFVCNHPYEGSLPHVPDMAVITPIYVNGVPAGSADDKSIGSAGDNLVGFAGTIAHKADVGGVVPGSTYGQATELFQEGMLLPPVKFLAAGRRNADLERLIAANSRAPDLVLGDLAAQVGVTRMGAARMLDICGRLGRNSARNAITAMIDGAASLFRAAVSDLPEGVHEAEGFMDSDGIDRDTPVRFKVAVTVRDGRIDFDFTGSSPQTKGPVNLRPALVEAVCYQALLGILDPGLPYSDAVRDFVTVSAPAGSVLNAASPAPVGSYMMACQKLIDVVLDALGRFRPERAIAHSGGSGGALTVAWREPARGRTGNQYEIFGSALGARNGSDGASGVTVHLSNIHVTPIEMIETEFPCRVTRYEPLPGTGGAGKYRGGDSMRRQYELLAPATVIYRGDRAAVPPTGLAGGRDGAPSRLLLHPGTDNERRMPSSCRLELEAGDCFAIEAAGGGGYGDPADRASDAIERRIGERYVAGPRGDASGA